MQSKEIGLQVFVKFMKNTIKTFETYSCQEYEELIEMQNQIKGGMAQFKTYFCNIEQDTANSYAEAMAGARAAAIVSKDANIVQELLWHNRTYSWLLCSVVDSSETVDRAMEEQNNSQKKFFETLNCFKRAVEDFENFQGVVCESHFLNVLHNLWLTQLSSFDFESQCDKVMKNIDELITNIKRVEQKERDSSVEDKFTASSDGTWTKESESDAICLRKNALLKNVTKALNSFSGVLSDFQPGLYDLPISPLSNIVR